MAFQAKGRSRPPSAGPAGGPLGQFTAHSQLAAQSMAARDAGARERASVMIVAMACSCSGLLVGLCLAAAHWPGLAFMAGAAIAGTGAWFARGLSLDLSNESGDGAQ